MTATTLAELARRLNSRHPAGRRLPPLLLLTDRRRLPDPRPAAARLPAGASVVLRHYDDPRRPALARDLAALCRARKLIFLVAGDGRLAAAVGADGLHLPEARIDAAAAWRRRRPSWLITAAAHSRSALLRAARAGADAALLAPVFATPSHPRARPLGPCRFAALVAAAALPVYGLGGIDARTARRLMTSGAVGFAAIGGLATLAD